MSMDDSRQALNSAPVPAANCTPLEMKRGGEESADESDSESESDSGSEGEGGEDDESGKHSTGIVSPLNTPLCATTVCPLYQCLSCMRTCQVRPLIPCLTVLA